MRVMMSFTWVLRGSSSAATQRRMMSRSVTMPRRPPSSPQTGREPTLCRDRSRAAREADSLGVMETTLGFIRSRTCMTKPPFSQTLLLVWTGKAVLFLFQPEIAPQGAGARQAKARPRTCPGTCGW